jgi:predicted nucleotidyltransferase
MKKIKLKTIKELEEFLKVYFKNKEVKIYLFGSRARGENSRFSDTDIGFLSDKDLSKDLVILRELVEESNIPYKVDMVDLSTNRELLEIVMKEGKRWL